jgi:hypothetical protein
MKGQELTFGVSGKLHANSLIMYDHQTDSLWSHLVGAAVSGPMKGQNLKPMQSMFTQWGTWKKLHANSKVMTSGRSSFFGSLRDPYESYYRSTDTGIIPTRLSDQRIYPKEYVLALVLNNKAKAYLFSALSKQPVVNDTFREVPLLVVFEPESATGQIFTRKVDGSTLSFKKAQPKNRKGLVLEDDATGSLWEGLSGRALSGRLKGKRLETIPTTPSFWFGWVDHYPETEIFTLQK